MDKLSINVAESSLVVPPDEVKTPNFPDTVHILPPTPQLMAMITVLRDRNTSRGDFVFTADRLSRLLVEVGLNQLPVIEKTVTTPLGHSYAGVGYAGKIAAVSILRAGDAMETAVRDVARSIRIGKILIQRDEKTATARLYYAKLPTDIADRYVLLLDPMLATGGSAIRAGQVLIDHGVQESRIVFLNLLSCPEGIAAWTKRFPKSQIVTSCVDQGLDDRCFIIPGLGDFGDLYFGSGPAPIAKLH